MWSIDQAYIDGAFVPVQGSERLEIANPSTEQVIGTVTLANRDDARRAIAAASRAQPALAASTKAQRIEMLRQLEAAVLARTDQIRDATIEEYGGPLARSQWVSNYASQCFATTAQALRDYAFERRLGEATVVMEPVGVAGLIAPWNAAAGSICSKLASAIAAGCASVIKPSELGPLQAQVVAEALHDAGLPAGVFNVLLGRGNDVGDEISTSPGIAKISFTGSTQTGKLIARAGVDTMKRVSLALSGKSATVVLDDAHLATVVPMALNAAFMNNGQACVAGTRLLIPQCTWPRPRNTCKRPWPPCAWATRATLPPPLGRSRAGLSSSGCSTSSAVDWSRAQHCWPAAKAVRTVSKKAGSCGPPCLPMFATTWTLRVRKSSGRCFR